MITKSTTTPRGPMRLQNPTLFAALLGTLLVLPAPPLPAADIPSGRLRVDPTSMEAGDIRAHLNATAEAATAKDLDGFADCFTKSSRAKIRKQAALRFVQHTVSMDVLETQVIRLAGNSCQAAVRYQLTLSDDSFDVVSLVALKREHGYWRIHAEKIQLIEHDSPRTCSPSRYACMSGTCQLK